MPGRKDSPWPVRRRTRSTGLKERVIQQERKKRGTQVTGFPVILSMRLDLSKTRLDRVVYRQLNSLYREHTSLAERLFPHPRRPRGSQSSRKRRNLRSGVFFFFFKGGRERHKGIIGRGHDLRLEKAGRKFASTGKRATGYRLSPNCFQKFKQMPASDWAQKMLCITVPNRRTVSPEFFS